MTARDELLDELEGVPEVLLAEILDYVRSVKQQASGELAIASEAVLGRDWLRPEEDDAWRDL